MPSDYVTPNVSEDLQDRLQSITQQILSRTRLLSIIDKLHLYGEGSDQARRMKRSTLMRKDIDIELVQREDKKGITGFTITYSAHDPQIAQQVTSELTDLFIDENLKARQQAVRRHHQLHGEPVGECKHEPRRAGGEGSRLRSKA